MAPGALLARRVRDNVTRYSYGVAILAAFLLLSGIAASLILYYRLAYILVLSLAGAYLWTYLNLRWLSIRVERRGHQVHVGEEIDEQITVRNESWLNKSWVHVEDLTDLPGHTTARAFNLPGKRSRTWRALTVCYRRGVYTLGPVRVESGDPFGLFRLSRYLPGQQQLLVYPRVVELPRFSIPEAEVTGEGPLRLRVHRMTPQSASVREYAPGDHRSQIHWPTTARLARLMSKEFDVGVSSDVWLLVDLDESVHARGEREGSDDLATTVAASIAKYLLDRDMPVGLLAGGARRVAAPPDRGQAQLERLLESLALAQTGNAVSMNRLLAEAQQVCSRYTTLVAITTSHRPDWLSAMRGLRQRQVRTAAVLVNAADFGPVASSFALAPLLVASGVPVYTVSRGDDLAAALAWPRRMAVPVAMGAKE